jgi:uncharacterized membrane protein YhhN
VYDHIVNHTPTIVFVVVTALACAALVYFLRVGWPGLAAGAKAIASSGFLATAISAGALQHRFGRVLFAGLVLSFFGDLFLVGTTRTAFLFGLSSFLLAHLAYIVAFTIFGLNRKWLAIAALPVLIVAVWVVKWLTPELPGELVLPVYAYISVISVMVITAFGSKGAGASTLLVVGAMMFFVSDLSVASQRILQSDFPTIIWGLPLYYAGQVCLALSTSQSSSQ